MKSGFLDERISREAEERPAKEIKQGQKVWDEKTLDTMVKILEEILNDNSRLARNDLERRVRTGTGVREFRGQCCGAPDQPVPRAEQDIAYRLISENIKPSALRDHVAPIMENASEIFNRVKSRGKADNMSMDTDSEIQVCRDVIKECMIRHILKVINVDNSGDHASGSHDAGLLATPQGYFGGDLDSFSSDTIRNLMERGYAYEDEWVKDTTMSNIYKEIEFLDYDGKLMEVQQQKMTGYRTDRICWLAFESLDREKQPGLQELFKKMISIPFELNKKCSLYLQASATFQIACYPTNGYYKKHVDGGYEDLNNGRKISAIYYANPPWTSKDGGRMKMYKRKPNPFEIEKRKSQGLEVPDQDKDEEAEQIEPTGGRLLIFRSRDMPHEVMMTKRKRYAITLWLMGPPGPGDQPDGHHTQT